MEASRYPEDVTTEDEKAYIDQYFEWEGIRLDPKAMQRNPGLRTVSKLMGNLFWGKMAQNSKRAQLMYVSDPAEYMRMMSDTSIEITDILYVSD